MPNFDYAIAELTVAQETAIKNAPVWEAEGNLDQAEASKRHAESYGDAISVLQETSKP